MKTPIRKDTDAEIWIYQNIHNCTPTLPILERGSTYKYTRMDYARYLWEAIKFAVVKIVTK